MTSDQPRLPAVGSPPDCSARGLSRRRFALAVPLLGAVAWGAAGRSWPATQRAAVVVRESRALMGTRVDIVACAEDVVARAAVAQAFAEMARLESRMSRYRSGSDVRRIAAAAGKHPVPVAPEVMAVLQMARQRFRESGGAFDITVGALAGWRFEPGHEAAPPAREIKRTLSFVGMDGLVLDERAGTAYLTRPGMALDLGGIAKLPILEAGMHVLAQAGVDDALLNGGGDVIAAGRLQGRPWRVGVRDPAAPARLLGVLELDGGGVVASSGDYERGFVRHGRRFHHVLDPRTGWPTRGVHGVALHASTVEAVNGWGAALMVRGPGHAPTWHAQHPEVGVLVAEAGGKRWLSPGMVHALKNIS